MQQAKPILHPAIYVTDFIITSCEHTLILFWVSGKKNSKITTGSIYEKKTIQVIPKTRQDNEENLIRLSNLHGFVYCHLQYLAWFFSILPLSGNIFKKSGKHGKTIPSFAWFSKRLKFYFLSNLIIKYRTHEVPYRTYCTSYCTRTEDTKLKTENTDTSYKITEGCYKKDRVWKTLFRA